MKKLIALVTLVSLGFVACEGDQGPPGQDGLDGLDGLDGIQGQVFEVENVDFLYESDFNLHSAIITFSDFTDFETLDSDAVLVYRFDGTVDFQNGDTANAWSLIPQSFFLDSGIIQYTASHTLYDVEILIDGNFNLSGLDAGFTQNQIFRVVILPSEFAKTINTSNLNTVMSALNIDTVQKLN